MCFDGPAANKDKFGFKNAKISLLLSWVSYYIIFELKISQVYILKYQIILRENRHCDPDLTITANGHDSAATNNHNLHENDLPTNEDSNPDFSRKSDYFEVMSDLLEDEEVKKFMDLLAWVNS